MGSVEEFVDAILVLPGLLQISLFKRLDHAIARFPNDIERDSNERFYSRGQRRQNDLNQVALRVLSKYGDSPRLLPRQRRTWRWKANWPSSRLPSRWTWIWHQSNSVSSLSLLSGSQPLLLKMVWLAQRHIRQCLTIDSGHRGKVVVHERRVRGHVRRLGAVRNQIR